MTQFYLTHMQKVTNYHEEENDSDKTINITIVEPEIKNDEEQN